MHSSIGGAVARTPLAYPAVIGTSGSLGVVLAGAGSARSRVPHAYRWWLSVGHAGHHAGYLVIYACLALLTVSWAAVGVHARHGNLTPRRAWTLLALWGTPLFVGAPVFSRDVYSYVADGVLARRGFNPYVASPHLLAGGPLYASIAEVWRHSSSPYGPLFEILAHLCASVAGSSLIAQVLVFRAVELLGVAALMTAMPILAKRAGVDSGVALWLVVLSPWPC